VITSLAGSNVRPAEHIRHRQEKVILACAEATQRRLEASCAGLRLSRSDEVHDGVQGNHGADAGAHALELGDGKGEVSTGGPACESDARGVNWEGGVGEDAGDEGFEVVDWAGEGGTRGLFVVEGDDEVVVAVGEGGVPVVVVAGAAEDETPAVNGEEGGEALGGL